MKTERLTLRRPQPEDEMNLYALDTDPEVMRWIDPDLSRLNFSQVRTAAASSQ